MTPYGAKDMSHDSYAKQMQADDELGMEQGRLPAQETVLEACHHPSGDLLATISRGGLVQVIRKIHIQQAPAAAVCSRTRKMTLPSGLQL